MVKARFGQHWRGKYYPKNEVMPASESQTDALVECGRGYYGVELTEPITPEITSKNTKTEIMAYLDGDGIEYDPELTKAQLLELL